MTPEEFTALVAAGERPGIEFKGARARDDKNFNEVARAVMGMAIPSHVLRDWLRELRRI